ncbi:SsrA-binding protein [Spirochaetota bacterium]|nr:SsrA-binding protein [Spirochaetota bacterium]
MARSKVHRQHKIKKSSTSKSHERTIARHKKAYFDYTVVADIEAGIVLVGSELKSIRKGAVNLAGSYAYVTDQLEVMALNIHIKEYQAASYTNHEARRSRKLLLKKKEIRKWLGKLKLAGHTLIPLELYFKKGLVKVKLALCVGKKHYDKRTSLKERDAKRKIEAFMKTRYLRK